MPTQALEDHDPLRNADETFGPDGLLSMMATMLREVMESEVSAVCAAGYGERSSQRTNSRNGYRERPFETRMGSVQLLVPKLRSGS